MIRRISQIYFTSGDKECIYRIPSPIDEVLEDDRYFERNFEIEQVTSRNEMNSGNLFLLPAQFIDSCGREMFGYMLFNPQSQEFSAPYFMVNQNDELVHLETTETFTFDSGTTGKCIADPKLMESLDKSFSLLYDGSPNDLLPWYLFRPVETEITLNVCYRLYMVAEDPNDPFNEPGSVALSWGLKQFNFAEVPDDGGRWYLPVRITFSSDQTKLGYAHYDGLAGKLINLFIWTSEGDQIAVLNDDKSIKCLKNYGIFKVNKKIEYELLLENRDKNTVKILSPNTVLEK